ncbi:hypothetical protein L2E82_32126 [Cichorium intybus]|uniref:Uncharacterized protein n=1 Tax=Cichorium intybus TaxID=13427 RepID=A0ACB9BGD2_CICIN|nr:hypothetical protein L2E82_32126 [Cichorium intybus]
MFGRKEKEAEIKEEKGKIHLFSLVSLPFLSLGVTLLPPTDNTCSPTSPVRYCFLFIAIYLLGISALTLWFTAFSLKEIHRSSHLRSLSSPPSTSFSATYDDDSTVNFGRVAIHLIQFKP